jgi:hypothetical protein
MRCSTTLWLEITRPGRCCRVVTQHDQHFLHGAAICHHLRRAHGWLVRRADGDGKTQTVKRSCAAWQDSRDLAGWACYRLAKILFAQASRTVRPRRGPASFVTRLACPRAAPFRRALRTRLPEPFRLALSLRTALALRTHEGRAVVASRPLLIHPNIMEFIIGAIVSLIVQGLKQKSKSQWQTLGI